MASHAEPITVTRGARGFQGLAPHLLTAATFLLLFAEPLYLLARDWWNDPEAGHGLLLAPIAIWLVWRAGIRAGAAPSRTLGVVLLVGAILLRYLSGLAAELFTMRFSMLLALLGVICFVWGWRQVLHWWLPLTLILLSIPIPAVLTNALAFPLQLQASAMGAALLEFRHVPVHLSGNVIMLPGQSLFVTEACSGLRSLTALLALGVLIGGLWLRHPATRVMLLVLTLPVAVLINAFRVFLTGFLVYNVSPEMGKGFMHLSEGWLLFVIAFAILGLTAWAGRAIEARVLEGRTNA